MSLASGVAMAVGGLWLALAAVVASVVAWVALTGGNTIKQGSRNGGEYDLGSGEMFDTIAPRYDLINKVLSLGLDMRWRQTMIDGLELKPGDRVMDMATGTADVAIMLSKELLKLGATTKSPKPVVGIDPSAKMIDVGRRKAADAGLSSMVQLRLGDAQDLADIPEGSVDKLTMAFGIRNVPDRLKALKEFRRIMAMPGSEDDIGIPDEGEAAGGGGEGGRGGVGSVVAILELQNPETGMIAYASRAFVKYAAPLMGWAMSGSGAEYGHLTNSIMAFPSVEEWTELMREADTIFERIIALGRSHRYFDMQPYR